MSVCSLALMSFPLGYQSTKALSGMEPLTWNLPRLINCNKSLLFINLQKFWLFYWSSTNRLRHYIIISADTLQQIHAQESLMVGGPAIFMHLLTIAVLTGDCQAVTWVFWVAVCSLPKQQLAPLTNYFSNGGMTLVCSTKTSLPRNASAQWSWLYVSEPA